MCVCVDIYTNRYINNFTYTLIIVVFYSNILSILIHIYYKYICYIIK